jgi:hypothetical protein
VKIHLSYSAEKTQVPVQNETAEIKAYQIIVWVRLSIHELLDPKSPSFPAIVDPGNNHNFSISEKHLVRWAGIQPALLKEHHHIREGGRKVPLRSAVLWLQGEEPFPLSLPEGIAVFSEAGPRLPILGLRALTQNKLRCLIFGEKKEASHQDPTEVVLAFLNSSMLRHKRSNGPWRFATASRKMDIASISRSGGIGRRASFRS